MERRLELLRVGSGKISGNQGWIFNVDRSSTWMDRRAASLTSSPIFVAEIQVCTMPNINKWNHVRQGWNRNGTNGTITQRAFNFGLSIGSYCICLPSPTNPLSHRPATFPSASFPARAASRVSREKFPYALYLTVLSRKHPNYDPSSSNIRSGKKKSI